MIVLIYCSFASPQVISKRENALLSGARSCLGNIYDARYYSGGTPPKGRGACTDVLYYALLQTGVNLRDEVDKDILNNPGYYTNISTRDRNIDYRRCPNLIIWFKGYTKILTTAVSKDTLSQWKPGDIVFWNFEHNRNGVADHCGIISDRRNKDGIPLVIHNLGPRCTEDDILRQWMIIGHFRYPKVEKK